MTKSNDDRSATLGIDPGAGAIKIYGAAGGIQLPSIVSVDGGRTLSRMAGLTQARPPLYVRTRAGSFWLGSRAPDWGRLVENLDHERFAGSPELEALLCGALSAYAEQHGSLPELADATVGLPLEALTGTPEETAGTGSSVRRWLVGEHAWEADGRPYRIALTDVRVSSQPAGALFDFLLDATGAFVPARKAFFGKEIGVVSVGMASVELLVVKAGAPVNRSHAVYFPVTAGQSSGVRRLLELAAPDGLYGLGELDTLLRAGKLDVAAALPIWAREVTGLIERRWGREFRRFALVIAVPQGGCALGGGVLLLRDALLARFGGKAFVPDDPVLATARGLYKIGRMQARRRRAGAADEAEGGSDGETRAA